MLDGDYDKSLNPKEFKEKMLDASDKIKYDFLTTKGFLFNNFKTCTYALNIG